MGDMYPNIRFVPVDFRGMTDHLRTFLGQMANVTRASSFCRDTFRGIDTLTAWRNRIAEWFIRDCDQEYLCCFDDDSIPVPSTVDMLRHPADVVGCRFFGKPGTLAHDGDGEFSMCAYKVSKRALVAMGHPRYRFVYNVEHTRAELCECLWFCQQARAAGFHPVKAGIIGHAMTVAVIPPTGQADECSMQFLHKIPMVILGADGLPTKPDNGDHSHPAPSIPAEQLPPMPLD